MTLRNVPSGWAVSWLGSTSKKIWDYLGVFPKCRTPPPPSLPPYLEGLRPNFSFRGSYCILGPKKHF